MFCPNQADTIKALCEKCNVGTNGTKLDCIKRLQSTLGSPTVFNKVLSQIWGASGGLLVATCPHKVVYAVKFVLRGESPRDFVDLLLSMQWIPTVTITDMPQIIALHANKRSPGTFHPHDGRLAEPTTENIRMAKEGKFMKDLPCLTVGETTGAHSDRQVVAEHSYQRQLHPATGTSERYCLFDWLHQNNSCQEREILRQASLVQQMRGWLNTQGVEQLFSNLGKSSYFLDQLTPANHVFSIRLIGHLHNIQVNQDFLTSIMRQQHMDVGIGEDGRVRLSTTKGDAESNLTAKVDNDPEVSVRKEYHRRLGPDDTIRDTPLQKQEKNATAGSKRCKVQACPDQLQPKGLSNPGDNRCWANAAIQCLTAIGAGDYFINNPKDTFLHWLGEFMSTHMYGQLGQPRVVDTTELIGKIRSEFPTLSSNGEQDSLEFLMLLLDRMEGPWTLKLSLKTKCNDCGWISPTCTQQDSLYHIHAHGVESDVLRVSELLHESFHEGLEGTQLPCKVKGHKGYQERSITSSSSGSFLILVMERAISYTDQATLSDSRDLEVEEKLSVGQHEYQLMAILCHTGSRTTGHYFAKTLREGQWYSFDDGRVSKFNIKKKRASQEYKAFFYRECARTQEDHQSHGLQEMESKTDLAQEMQLQEEILAEIDGEKVTRKDMQGLNGTNLLNDNIVNFYMKMIMERSRLTGYPRVHAFCSFFYQQLLQNGYSSVKNWTKRDDLFSMDLVLVPVHLRVKKHWCLAVMDMRSKCINYFDSMGEMNKECLECLRGYLQEEHKRKKGTDLDLSKWTTNFPKNLPKQLNSFDCGVFACKYAEVASRDAKMSFTQHDIPAFRRQMVGEILDKKLKGKKTTAVESMSDSSAASPPDSSVCGSGGASIHDDERPKQSESQNAGLDLDIEEPLTDSRSDCAELQRRIQARENFTHDLLFGPCEELELRGYFTAVRPYLQRLANGEMPENVLHRVFYGRNQAGQPTQKQLWDMHHTRAFEFEQATFISQCILDEVKVPIDDLVTKANYEVMVLLPEALAAIYKERKGLATMEEARNRIWLASFQLDLD
ncbi:uncharacterized protein LOC118408807 [Branchiostoma floridae]|uniref:Uncharacterized protein LOC118408807 n=1 Tax=Branchiostoma floridae TaxID=7739 RepID=A0A9J7KCQ0_BRAFL|nr:uncharacterized protein LOC118408807 [Branchiostoma floridae]